MLQCFSTANNIQTQIFIFVFFFKFSKNAQILLYTLENSDVVVGVSGGHIPRGVSTQFIQPFKNTFLSKNLPKYT